MFICVLLFWDDLLAKSAFYTLGWRVNICAVSAGRGLFQVSALHPHGALFSPAAGSSVNKAIASSLCCSYLLAQLIVLLSRLFSSQSVRVCRTVSVCLLSKCPTVKFGFSFSQQGNQGPGDSDCKGRLHFATFVFMESQFISPFLSTPPETPAVWDCSPSTDV